MILKEFHHGWGDNYELRKFEKHIVALYLRSWHQDAHYNLVVNSTWYNLEYHEQVLDCLRENNIRRLALVSFMDPAIVQENWFKDHDVEVRCLGYYRGKDEIDVWALILDKYFTNLKDTGRPEQLDTAFLCYNRKPHPHRTRLYAELQSKGCLQHGIVTLGNESGIAKAMLSCDVAPSIIAPNPGIEQYGIVNDIMSLGPDNIWHRCFLNVVTETVFDVDQNWFVSEKIYKPVIGMRPFLVFAPQGARQWLEHIGISNFIDDFKDITELDLSLPESIPEFLLCLASQGSQYYQHKYQQLHEKMQFNLSQFRNHVDLTWHKVRSGIG